MRPCYLQTKGCPYKTTQNHLTHTTPYYLTSYYTPPTSHHITLCYTLHHSTHTTPHHPALFLTTPNHAVTHHTTSHHSHNSTSSHLFPHHSTTQLQSTPHQGHITPFSAFFTLYQSCTHYTIKPQQTTPTTSSCILSHTSTRYANEQRRSRHYPTPLNQQYNLLPRFICMRERFLFVPHRFNFPP